MLRTLAAVATLSLAMTTPVAAQDAGAPLLEAFIALCEAHAADPDAAIAAAEGIGWTRSQPDPAPAERAAGANRFREAADGDRMLSLMVGVSRHDMGGGSVMMNDCNVGGYPADPARLRTLFRDLTGLAPSPALSLPGSDAYFYLVDGDRRTAVAPGQGEAEYRRLAATGRLRFAFVGERNGYAMMQMFAPQDVAPLQP